MHIPPRHHVVLIKTSIVYGVVNGKINECSKENRLILNNFTNLLAATGRKCLFLWWLHTFLLIDVIFYFFFPMFWLINKIYWTKRSIKKLIMIWIELEFVWPCLVIICFPLKICVNHFKRKKLKEENRKVRNLLTNCKYIHVGSKIMTIFLQQSFSGMLVH